MADAWADDWVMTDDDWMRWGFQFKVTPPPPPCLDHGPVTARLRSTRIVTGPGQARRLGAQRHENPPPAPTNSGLPLGGALCTECRPAICSRCTAGTGGGYVFLAKGGIHSQHYPGVPALRGRREWARRRRGVCCTGGVGGRYWAGLSGSVTPECQHCLVFNRQATLADGGS